MADPSTHRHLMNLFAESPPGARFALGACRGPEWSGVSSAVLEKHLGPQAGRGQRAWSGNTGRRAAAFLPEVTALREGLPVGPPCVGHEGIGKSNGFSKTALILPRAVVLWPEGGRCCVSHRGTEAS